MKPPAQLLAPFDQLTKSIKTTAGVPESHWLAIYLPVLNNYAELCQRLPASEAHHHAELGGLLRHGLETILEALTLRRNQLLPAGAPAEEIASQQDLWTYATVTAALLHDVGKPITDLVVTYISPADTQPKAWQPLTAMLPTGAHYRFRFNPQRQYHRHALTPPLLVHRILPQVGLNWLASQPAVFDAWLATISGTEDAGPLAAIAHAADGASVARDLSGGVRTRSPAARAKPLAERLLTGLRHMVRAGTITLNRPGASGFVSEGSLWLVSKRVLDDLREHLTKEGQTGIPGRNDRLMDELQQWHIIEANGDKAVWFCEIRIGDWRQTLSCLRMELTQIWPDLKDVPTTNLSVSPSAQPSAPGAASAEAADDRAVESLGEKPAVSKSPSANDAELSGRGAGSNKAPDTDSSPIASSDRATMGQRDTERARSAAALAETSTDSSADDEGNTDLGQRFVEWLKTNIREGRIEINTARARVHVLTEGLALITPGIFRDFSPHHWERAQKRFQKLRLHAKTEKDTNVWTCQVAKDRRSSTVKVMLIPDPEATLGIEICEPNPVLTLLNADRLKPPVRSPTFSDKDELE
ncbi:MAG: TraI domain-containing protein [Chromatiaceae bacterium]|nr:TraI domain-containing protein [Chromatiaceae bacterium]